MGLGNAEIVASYMTKINYENVDIIEALAAREYFANYHKGLNRRTEDPINSRLNYGYAVVRSAIIRSLVSAGFHPAFGIHHNNQLNLFNLADDLIEPFRAMVDMVAINNAGNNIILNKNERRNLANVLHNACKIDETKVSILVAID